MIVRRRPGVDLHEVGVHVVVQQDVVAEEFVVVVVRLQLLTPAHRYLTPESIPLQDLFLNRSKNCFAIDSFSNDVYFRSDNMKHFLQRDFPVQ